MNQETWLRILLVGVPVLSLVGAWMALRTFSGRTREPDQKND